MMNLGWCVALIIWVLGMWSAFRVNQAIIEIEYREQMQEDFAILMLVYVYSFFVITLWPIVQLLSMQRAFVHSGDNEEEE